VTVSDKQESEIRLYQADGELGLPGYFENKHEIGHKI
jgi:hypothetical protein